MPVAANSTDSPPTWTVTVNDVRPTPSGLLFYVIDPLILDSTYMGVL